MNAHHPNAQINTGNARRGRLWVVGATIAAAGALGLPAIASASATPADAAASGEVPPGLEERIDVLCARIPNLQTRTSHLIARLESDATTRGSLAWLADQVARAQTNGRDDLAVMLESRLAVRTETLDVLKLRVDALADAAVFCEGRAT